MTQAEKILHIMGQNRAKVWWTPPDLMKETGELFIGYEASARFSELAKAYPEMFVSTKLGKYVARKINWNTSSQWIDRLPDDLKRAVRKYL